MIGAAATTALAVLAAAAPHGSTTIALDGPVATSLRAQHVAFATSGPARGGARRLVLPVASGTVRGGATLVQRGAVTLRVKRGGAGRRARTLTLTRWRVRVQDGRVTLSAVAGRRRRALLAATVPSRRLQLDTATGGVRLSAVPLRLTRVGARLIRTQLRLKRLPAGVLGRLRVAARVGSGASGGGGTGGGRAGGGNTGGGGGGGGGTVTAPPGCTPGFGSAPIAPAPAPLARPAGAADVSAATFSWRPKESFVQYVNSGEGTTASDGATSGTPERATGNGAKLVYAFGFRLLPGSWLLDAQHARLLGQGTVRFHYSGHGIDIRVKNPEIELDGAAARAVFTFVGGDCTQITETRGVMLDLAAGTPTVSGSTYDYGAIPGTITRSGAAMFSGFYIAGDPWGSFGLSLTAAP